MRWFFAVFCTVCALAFSVPSFAEPIPEPCSVVIAWPDAFEAVITSNVPAAVWTNLDSVAPVSTEGIRRTTSGPGIGQWRRA